MDQRNLIDLFKDIENDVSDNSKFYDELEEGIKSKSYNLLQIVENLGILLTNIKTDIRKKGVEILSKVLSLLSKEELNEKELDYLILFYIDRLKDHHSLIPEILQGLHCILDMKNLPNDSYMKLFPYVFIHYHNQSQIIQDRKLFYDIIFKCINFNLNGLKPMGPDFVYGVIQAIEGERDPRNLMFLFSTFIPCFLKKFDLGHLKEEMFDVMACYFPVDFSPKSNDPDSITRDDLSFALIPNLISKQEFAEFCFPLALEKLDSDLKVAKLDSIKLLIEACKIFSIEIIISQYKNIWNVVKNDFNNKDIRKEIITLLYIILTKLPEEHAINCFNNIYDLLKYTFNNIDSNLYINNIHVLITICKDQEVCIKQLAIHVLPLIYIEIIKQDNANGINNTNEEYIKIFNEIINICINNFNINLIEIRDISIDWNNLIEYYIKIINNNYNNKYEIIHSLNAIKILYKYINENYRLEIYQIFSKIIKSNNNTLNATQNNINYVQDIKKKQYKEQDKQYKQIFEQCLCIYSLHYKDEIYNSIIKPIQNEIKQNNEKNMNQSVYGKDIKTEILNDLIENNKDVYIKSDLEVNRDNTTIEETNESNMKIDYNETTTMDQTPDDPYIKPIAYRKNSNNEEMPIYIAICPMYIPPAIDNLKELYIKNLYAPLISIPFYLETLSDQVINYCLYKQININSDDNFLFCSNHNNDNNNINNLSYLKYILEKYENDEKIINYLNEKFNIFENIIEFYFNAINQIQVQNNELTSWDDYNDELNKLIDSCLPILNILINKYNEKQIINIINKNIEIIFKKLNISNNFNCFKSIHFNNDNFSCENNYYFIILIPLINYINLNKIEKENKEFINNISKLFNYSFYKCINNNYNNTNKYNYILLSLLLNQINNIEDGENNIYNINIKLIENTMIELNKMVDINNIADSNKMASIKNNLFYIHIYITKSLLLKGYKNLGNYWLDKLFSIINFKSNNSFNNIFNYFQLLIYKENLHQDYFLYKNIKFLYRQKLFNLSLKYIINNMKQINENNGIQNEESNNKSDSDSINKELTNQINTSSSNTKTNKEQTQNNSKILLKLQNYLPVLLQLENLSKQVILLNIKVLLPILIETLNIICKYYIQPKKNNNQINYDIVEEIFKEIGFNYKINKEEKKIDTISNEEQNGIDIISSKEENIDNNSKEYIIIDNIFNENLINKILNIILNIFLELLEMKCEIINNYISSLIYNFSYLCLFHNNFSIRILSLKCLYYLSYFNLIEIIKYKNNIIKLLNFVKNDKKRLVRKQNVITIDRWFIIDNDE